MRYSDALDNQDGLARWVESRVGQRYAENFCRGYDKLTESGLVKNSFARLATRRYQSIITDFTQGGETYYWSHDLCDLLVNAAKKLPVWWAPQPDVIPYSRGYLYFSKPLPMTPAGYFGGKAPADEPLRALGWTTVVLGDTRQIAITSIVLDSTGLRGDAGIPTTMQGWSFGQSISELLAATEGEGPKFDSAAWQARYCETLQYFAAAMLLLAQNVFIAIPEQADRATRRRVQRPRPVNVLYLRRLYNLAKQRGVRPSDIEWAYRWFVSAHWHRYWYGPKNGERRLVPKWMSPYIKGDAELPLKPAPVRVHAVVR